MPQSVMIFAAGFGTRMRDLTRKTPKPLLRVAGVPLIDHAIRAADKAGLSRIVVNVSYLGQQITAHLGQRADILISDEGAQALETGGGLKKALDLFDESPVFTMNPDAIWTGDNPFQTLTNAWDPERMDALLLLQPLEKALAHKGAGDFGIASDGALHRRSGSEPAFVNTGVQIIRTERIRSHPGDIFSLNVIWDQMLADKRMFGVVHNGGWVDVGTPEGIKAAEAHLAGAPDV